MNGGSVGIDDDVDMSDLPELIPRKIPSTAKFSIRSSKVLRPAIKPGKRSDAISWVKVVSKRKKNNITQLKKDMTWSKSLKDKLIAEKNIWKELSSASSTSSISSTEASFSSESDSNPLSSDSSSSSLRRSERLSGKRKRDLLNEVIQEVNGIRDVLVNLENCKKRRVTWADQVQQHEAVSLKMNNHITTFVGDTFPFLDVGIKANDNGSIHFVATRKENQLVKYVSSSSDHTQTVLRAIPLGVLERLAKLTSLLEEKKNKSMLELYPAYV